MSTEVRPASALGPPFEPVAPPLEAWADGSIRVGGTRLLLHIVVNEHLMGETPEQIARNFPPLTIAEAYAVIAYYHANREAVDAHLAWVESEGRRLQALIEALPGHAERVKRMNESIERNRQDEGLKRPAENSR